MSRHFRTLLPYVVVIAVTAAIFMWPAPDGDGEPPEKEDSPQAVSVRTIKVYRDDLSGTFETTGTAETWAHVSVSSQMEGTLTQVDVETGARVRTGQLLARLDDRLLRADMKQAEASLTRSTDHRLLLADLKRAEAALAQSTEELARVEQLAEKRLVDQNRLQTAIAQKRLDEANVGKAENSVQAAITQKRLDEVSVERLQTLLSLTSLHSPIDGIVTSERRYPGETVSKGAPLFAIADISRLRILTRVPESIARRLQVGSSAVVRIDALDDKEIRASVRRIHPVSDPASHQVSIELDAGSVFPTLQPGNLVTVIFTTDTRKGTLIVDRAAVPDVTRETEIDVFRVNGGLAERRRVRIGLILENRVEILSGLAEGDSVIVGAPALTDGDPVQVLGPGGPEGEAR